MADDHRKINATKNYRLFHRHRENRPMEPGGRKKLLESMKRYGFLRCYPIVCVRNAQGHLIVKDGQHRLAIAETLGLAVHWVEEADDFDVALTNSASKPWRVRDYAQKHAANGLAAYQEGIEFAEENSIPLGMAFALLAGTTSFGNCATPFMEGKFQVKDRDWAHAVAWVYQSLTDLSSVLKNARFLQACMAVCRVKEFDPTRLMSGASRCRERLVAYSTKEAYIDMLEAVYNFGNKRLFGLKAAATMAMRERRKAHPAKASE